jgi:hypothetical protein
MFAVEENRLWVVERLGTILGIWFDLVGFLFSLINSSVFIFGVFLICGAD